MGNKVTDYTELAFPGFVNHFGATLGRSHPEWSAEFAKNLARIHTEVGVAYAKAYDAALTDPDVSEAGRAKALRTLTLDALKRVEAFQASLVAPLRTRIASLEASLAGRTEFKPPTDTTERLAFEFERNRFLAPLTQLDAVQRREVYLGLTDPALLFFMESAKPLVRIPDALSAVQGVTTEPFVDPDAVREVRLARMQQLAPEDAGLLEDMIGLAGFYETFLNTVRTLLSQDLPPEAPKPRETSTVLIQPPGSAGGIRFS